MADVDGIQIKLGVDASDVDRAIAKLLNSMARELQDVFKKMGNSKQAQQATEGMNASLKQSRVSAEALGKSIAAINSTTLALAGSFGKAFDPKTLDGVADQLKRVAELEELLKQGADELGDVEYNRLKTELAAVSTALIPMRDGFKLAARAADETARNVERNARQVSRVQVEESRSARSRYVVDAQSASSAARDAARAQIESTKASSRQRVAIIQAAARTIATIERGLRALFNGTARTISAAFRGVGNTVSGVATGISSAFRRSSTDITNNVSNSYSKTFKNATNTVTSETRQQTSVINNFAREASASIGSIGAGAKLGLGAAIGGILGVGAAKALSGGFQRATTIETANRGLEVLLGNAEEAEALLGEVVEVVTGTPFRLDQFAEGAARLVAFNVQADKIPGILAAAGDAAALSGANAGQVIDTLIRVTGQATASGKIYGDGILSLADAGIPALRILGNAFNENTADIQEMLTDGAIPAEKALDALFKGIVEGTDGVNGTTRAFGGLAKSLGDTLAGSLSNFNIAFSRLGANLFKVFTPAIVAASKAGAAAIDLIGSALLSVANSIQGSPLFGALLNGLESLNTVAVKAKTSLKPLFDFLSEGIVLFAQFAGALFLFRRIPGALAAVASAFKFILTPQRLLIAGGVLLASYFKKLYDDSITLREGIGEVAAVLSQIATVIKDLVVDSFQAVISAFRGAGDATAETGSRIKGVLRPALERLASFLENTVLPAVRNFARTMRDDVLPFIGTALSKAVNIAKTAFSGFVELVGPVLARAVEIGRNALAGLIQFATTAFNIIVNGGATLSSEGWLSSDGPVVRGLFAIREAFKSLSEFVESNVTPVLIGVGSALGVLALSGGNIPLAGLVGLTAGIVAVLSNEDIRNALFDSVQEAVKRAQGALKELFDGVTVGSIIKGALKVANQVGKVLGDIASDRRLLAGLAGIVAAAAALAAAFVAGFVEGIINNIPELIAGLSNALEVAFEAAVKGFVNAPLLTKALVAAFAGVGVLAAIAAAGRKASQTFQKAATFGPTLGTAPRNGASGFVSALFGGPGAIDRQVTAQVAKTEAQLKREFQRLQRVALAATGDVVKTAEGKFLKTTDARSLTAGIQEIENRIGKTNLAAASLRAGIGQVGDAFRKNTPFLANFSSGLRSIGEGIKGAGPAIGRAAGIVAGGAFAAAFVSRAIFDVNSSGIDKLQAGIGLFATSAATGAAIGGVTGAVVGAAVGGFGVITSKLNANKKAAEAAEERIRGYAAAIRDASKERLPDLFEETVSERSLKDLSDSAKDALIDIGFSFEELGQAIADGTSADLIGPLDETVLQVTALATSLERGFQIGLQGVPFGLSELQALNLSPLVEQLLASGASANDVNQIINVLGGTITELDTAQQDAARSSRLLGEAGDRTGRGAAYLSEQMQAATGALEAGAAASQAYKDKLAELNDVRIQELENKVNDARDALNEAGSAADAAKEKLRQFLSGETTEVSAEQKIRDAVIAADSLGDSVANIDLNGPLNAVDTSKFETAVGGAQALVGGLIADAQPANAADLAKLVDPLKQAITESDASPEVQGWLLAGVENAIASYQTPEGQSLLGGIVDQVAENAAAQAVFDTALQNLKVGETLPADLFVLNTDAAETAATTAAQDVIDGWVTKLDGNTEMQDALKAQGEAAIEDFLASVGTNSPSTITKQAGVDVAQGFVNGIKAGALRMTTMSRSAGVQAMTGLAVGLRAGSSAVYATIRLIGERMIEELRNELKIESPSKVTEEIGEQTIEGFIKGVDDSLPLIDRIAFSAGTFITEKFTSVGKRAGQAIGIGFAEEGAGFAGSVAGAMDDAFRMALSKVDQFKAIGKAIGTSLFAGQGTTPLGVVGGGPGAVNLQEAFLNILGNTDRLSTRFQERAKELGGFAFTFDAQFGAGRDNQRDFLEAGKAVRDYGQTLLEGGRSASSAVGEMKVYRDQIIAVARGMGASQSQIDQMINTLGLSDAQLQEFVNTTAATAAAAAKAAEEAERAIKNQENAEKAAEARRKAEEAAEKAARDAEDAWEKAADAAEKAAQDAADRAREEEERRRREYTLPGPAFRDLVIQSPSGDPEAVALAVANRVAFSIRR